jgi:hypothetical protein
MKLGGPFSVLVGRSAYPHVIEMGAYPLVSSRRSCLVA